MNSRWKLLEPHLAALHALLLRLAQRDDVAADLLHELILKLHRSAAFSNAREPGAYARRAAINMAMDWRRSNRRRGTQERMPSELPTTDSGPDESAEAADSVAAILDTVAELSPLSRDAFLLRYVQQESYERVGEIIGRTAHQARGICHAAVKSVRMRLTEKQVNYA